MIFKKKEAILESYSVDQCMHCHKTTKRKFKDGDFVFKILENCTTCNVGKIVISKIFGEPIK